MGRSARVAADELGEGAVLAVRPPLLVEQRQVLLVELPEPLVPGDRLELVLAGAAGEIDPQHAGVAVVARAAHARGPAAVLLHPAADLLVIGRGVRLRRGHRSQPPEVTCGCRLSLAATLTGMRCGLRCSGLGMRIVSTPSCISAATVSGSSPGGTRRLRSKRPKPRSTCRTSASLPS